MSEASDEPTARTAARVVTTPLGRHITSMPEHPDDGARGGAQRSATHSGESGHWHLADPVDRVAREDDALAMPGSGYRRAAELRRLVLALVRAGRTPEALSHEFEPTAQALWNWVMRVARDAGREADRLASAEREELRQLRREVRQLHEERDRLAKADTWYIREIVMSTSRASN